MSGWIGVDLDRTLAYYEPGQMPHIGKPIPLMYMRVKFWLMQGKKVKIVTARVAASGLPRPGGTGFDDAEFAAEQRKLIEDWCLKHFGTKLEVTATKDFDMVELWDDRAIRVQPNTGEVL